MTISVTLNDQIAFAIEATERAYACTLSIHDVGGGLASFCDSEKLQHQHPYCQAVKYHGFRHACSLDDGDSLLPRLKENPQAQIRQCHAAVVEVIIGLPIHGRLDAVLFAGLGRAEQTHKQQLFREAKIEKPKIWNEEYKKWICEGMTQLALRLQHILETHFQADEPIDIRSRKSRIEQFIRYRHTHTITLDDLAEQLELSKERSRRVVKELFNKSWTELVNEQRLATAISLLKSGDLTMLQIAIRSGFGGAEQFHRSFKAKYSISPKRWLSDNK